MEVDNIYVCGQCGFWTETRIKKCDLCSNTEIEVQELDITEEEDMEVLI